MPSQDPRPSGKHDAWRDVQVASTYDARRFSGGLKGLKNRHDGTLLARILADLPEVSTVLDLPTGTGRLLASLDSEGRRLVGADRSFEMLQASASRAAGTELGAAFPALVQADVRALPFVDAAFDVVVCMRFLFHLRAPAERIEALAEIARVARRAVVVQVRHRANIKQAGRWLRSRVGLSRRWRPAQTRVELEAELLEAGLEPLRGIPVSWLLSDKLLLVARPRS